jgi:hypothetical protein
MRYHGVFLVEDGLCSRRDPDVQPFEGGGETPAGGFDPPGDTGAAWGSEQSTKEGQPVLHRQEETEADAEQGEGDPPGAIPEG